MPKALMIAKYIGIPRTILNVNVIPKDIGSNKLMFASGTAKRIAAGTAIYDALANNTVNNKASPASNPINAAVRIPNKLTIGGKSRAKPVKNTPDFFSSLILLAAISPLSLIHI